MSKFEPQLLKKLYASPKDAHKGAGGKLTIIGGSHLFHGASLWSLKVASRIVDMVFYSSVSENNELTKSLKSELYDFIAVTRESLDEYIEQSDAVLIGPGLAREEGRENGEESTRELTRRLLQRFPLKKWVIDAGSLTEMKVGWLEEYGIKNAILTPHKGEFEKLVRSMNHELGIKDEEEMVTSLASELGSVILLKGATDIVSDGKQTVVVEGGNVGMIKGGTGDVLAGLVAALYCKNDPLLAATAGSYINKKAGESLAKRVGIYYNASDLCDEIPKTMHQLLNG